MGWLRDRMTDLGILRDDKQNTKPNIDEKPPVAQNMQEDQRRPEKRISLTQNGLVNSELAKRDMDVMVDNHLFYNGDYKNIDAMAGRSDSQTRASFGYMVMLSEGFTMSQLLQGCSNEKNNARQKICEILDRKDMSEISDIYDKSVASLSQDPLGGIDVLNRTEVREHYGEVLGTMDMIKQVSEFGVSRELELKQNLGERRYADCMQRVADLNELKKSTEAQMQEAVKPERVKENINSMIRENGMGHVKVPEHSRTAATISLDHGTMNHRR